jgi:hypothetical protein
MNKIAIVANTQFQDLYNISRSFYANLPYEQRSVSGRNHFYSMKFLNHVITDPTFQSVDIMVYVDEDCFIVNPIALEALIEYFIDNNLDCIGMPDGGVVKMRYHSPVAINQFFCILNLKSIREKYNASEVESTRYTDDLAQYAPQHLMRFKYAYDDFEDYYQLFLWMIKNNFRVYYLDAECSPLDGKTTILKNHNNEIFAYHTWYGRDWNNSHKARITNIIEHCKQLRWNS